MSVGRRLGNYDIERELGRGGMGAVYVGKHQLLGRAAAVKVLQAQYSKDQDVVKRFFNEARAATAIRHPSIVEIFDFGFADDGSAFIVMELCDGESLATRLRRTRVLATPIALAITRQMAGALAAAHKAGIIHRDLKPDNVFLVPDPEVMGGERIKLLDFGIAKLAGDASSPSATQTGAILGTPYYMSPEQCRGAGHIDHRSDLYSLGCILFEMVCGRVPFVGEGAGDIIGAHLHLMPTKPSAMAPGLAADVEALILSLLAKKADERPARADLVVSTIHTIAGTKPEPSRENVGLLSTAAGSEPGKKPSPAIAFGDTVGSSPKIAAPSAIGSSPGLDSTQPSSPPGAVASVKGPSAVGSSPSQPSSGIGSSSGPDSTQPSSPPAAVVLASSPSVAPIDPQLVASSPSVAPIDPQLVASSPSVAPIDPQLVASSPAVSMDPQLVASSPAVVSMDPHLVASWPSGVEAEPQIAHGTPSVVYPKRTTARLSAQMPSMPLGQKLVVIGLVLAAIGAGLAAYVMLPKRPSRVAHQVPIADTAFDASRTEARLEIVDGAKPGDPPAIRATVIDGPRDVTDSSEVFALVEPESKIATAMPAASITPLAESNDLISIVVLVQGTESWIGFGANHDGASGIERSFDVLNALNTTLATADLRRLEQTEITFLEYSTGTSSRGSHRARELGPTPLGGKGSYVGKEGRDLAFGVTRAVDLLANTYAARKALIVIGDGTDTNDDYAKKLLQESKKQAANAGIKVFGVVFKTSDSYPGTVLKYFIPSLLEINSIDGFANAIASIINRLDDRYYVTFASHDRKDHYGLSLDGQEHDLVVRIGREELEPVTLTLPRWQPPLGKPTRSWILAGGSAALLLLAGVVALRGRRQRQLLAIPRA